MIIGICGAHRSGKTTLARKFCKKNKDFAFVETSVSQMVKDLGYNSTEDYPIEVRLQIQNEILDALDFCYSNFASETVFDRTPLDAAAYMLADVQRQNVSPVLQAEIVKYVERCIDITNRRFGMLLFVPSVLPLIEEEGKAPATPAYVEHIATLINGLRGDQRVTVKSFIMPRSILDIDQRVKAMENAAGKTVAGHIMELEGMYGQGVSVH